MTYATILGDCIERVTSQDGDKSSKTGTQCNVEKASSSSIPLLAQTFLASGNRRQIGWTRLEHKTLWTTPQKRTSSPGNRKQATSQMNVDTHLSDKEVSTNEFLENEAVKELSETNTKAIERIKIGSNKICIREDLAKENMMLCQESSQAVFEMGNEELIELKTSRIQCPSCLLYVVKEPLFVHVASMSDR